MAIGALTGRTGDIGFIDTGRSDGFVAVGGAVR